MAGFWVREGGLKEIAHKGPTLGREDDVALPWPKHGRLPYQLEPSAQGWEPPYLATSFPATYATRLWGEFSRFAEPYADRQSCRYDCSTCNAPNGRPPSREHGAKLTPSGYPHKVAALSCACAKKPLAAR